MVVRVVRVGLFRSQLGVLETLRARVLMVVQVELSRLLRALAGTRPYRLKTAVLVVL